MLIECMISGEPYLTLYNKTIRQITTIEKPWNTKTGEGYLYGSLGSINNSQIFYGITLDLKELISKLDPAGTKLVNKGVLENIDPESNNRIDISFLNCFQIGSSLH